MDQEEIEIKIRSMLPEITPEMKNLVQNLPEDYMLEVPFVYQEQHHWSGAAVVKMVTEYFGVDTGTQEDIVKDAGWEDWRKFNHSTFKEKMSEYFLNKNFVTSEYYPSKYVASKMENGIIATDFIRSNIETFTKIDFEYFKAFLVSREAPLIARLHFTKYQYPMDERLIQRLDYSGHCVLIVGYNKDGFIIHDPWNKDLWGGERGGSYSLVTYKSLKLMPFVNYSLDCCIAVDKLKVYFEEVKESVHSGKEIKLSLVCEWPGISDLDDWHKLSPVKAELHLNPAFSQVSNAIQVSREELLPGKKIFFEWYINVGDQEGSYPVDVDVSGRINAPKIPWEQSSEEINAPISAHAHKRICVFEKNFLMNLGKYFS